MNKKFLYTCGCSFTNWAELDANKQWPKLLADKLDLTCINEGISNGSNYRTFRKLMNFLKTANVDETVFVIQFTYPFRFEMQSSKRDHWYRINFNSAKGNIKTCIHPENGQLASDSEVSRAVKKMKAKLINYTEEAEDLEFMMEIMSIINLLKSKNAEYYLTSLPSITETYHSFQGTEKWIINNYKDSEICSQYDDSNDPTWNDFHPSPNGNKEIANAFYKGIIEHRRKEL